MHAQMLMILLVTVLVAQVVLVEWRKRHFRSYQVRITNIFYLDRFCYECNLLFFYAQLPSY